FSYLVVIEDVSLKLVPSYIRPSGGSGVIHKISDMNDLIRLSDLDEVDYRVDCTLIVVRDLRIADNDVPLDHSVSSCDSHSLSSPQNTSNPQMRHGATDHRRSEERRVGKEWR